MKSAVAVESTSSEKFVQSLKNSRVSNTFNQQLSKGIDDNASGTITADEIMKQQIVLVKQRQERARAKLSS